LLEPHCGATPLSNISRTEKHLHNRREQTADQNTDLAHTPVDSITSRKSHSLLCI